MWETGLDVLTWYDPMTDKICIRLTRKDKHEPFGKNGIVLTIQSDDLFRIAPGEEYPRKNISPEDMRWIELGDEDE
jgi:hypothetical protein